MDESLWEQIVEYYRKKRIDKILVLYETEFEYERPGKSKPLLSRDTKVRLVLTLIFLILNGVITASLRKMLPAPFVGIISITGLFLAVELSDYIWLKSVRALDFLFDVALPLIVVLSIGSAFVYFKYIDTNYSTAKNMQDKFQQWKIKKNRELAKPKQAVAAVEGANWKFKVENNQYVQATAAEARQFCESLGPGWSVTTRDDFSQLRPPPEIPKLSVWMGGVAAAQFRNKIDGPPSVFSTGDEHSMAFVLCINRMVK